MTPPTCTEQGFTTHTCDRCGDTYVDAYTAPAGHTWGAWQESADEHWQTCAVCGEETGRGEHEYTGDTDTDCAVCGHVRTVITPDMEVRVARAALTAVPDGLKDTPFATVPLIKGELSRVLLTDGYTAGKVAYYDAGCELVFEVNGGEPLASLRLPYETNVDLTKHTPVRPGYDFAGWYADVALTRKIESVQLLDHSTTVYAAWTETVLPPQTGDHSHTGLWLALLLASLCGLWLLTMGRRRQSGKR